MVLFSTGAMWFVHGKPLFIPGFPGGMIEAGVALIGRTVADRLRAATQNPAGTSPESGKTQQDRDGWATRPVVSWCIPDDRQVEQNMTRVTRATHRGPCPGRGFRWSLMDEARRLGLDGWVRNRADTVASKHWPAATRSRRQHDLLVLTAGRRSPALIRLCIRMCPWRDPVEPTQEDSRKAFV